MRQKTEARMEIVVKTTIGFKLPEDYDLHKIFVDSVDLREWTRHSTTALMYYTKTNHNMIQTEKEETPKKRRGQGHES